MIFWKEALIAAGISIFTESMLIKSKHLPEQFFIIFASTMFANHILSIDFFDNRPMYGPENLKPSNKGIKAPMYTSKAKTFPFTPAPPITPIKP